MKSEFGLWTSHFFLCFFFSSSKQEYSKSLAKGMLVLPQAQPVQISKVTFPGSNTPLGTQRPLSSSSFYNIYLAAPGFSWDAGFSCPHPGGILVPWPKGSNWSPLHCKAYFKPLNHQGNPKLAIFIWKDSPLSICLVSFIKMETTPGDLVSPMTERTSTVLSPGLLLYCTMIDKQSIHR